MPDHAFNNAMRVIRWERAIGTYHEESIQDWFLPHRTFLQFWNTYYGVAHFVVTLGVFIVLFVRRPAGLPTAPQHARRHDRAGDRRLRVLPVDAAAPARRAMPRAGAAG